MLAAGRLGGGSAREGSAARDGGARVPTWDSSRPRMVLQIVMAAAVGGSGLGGYFVPRTLTRFVPALGITKPRTKGVS